MGDYPLCLIAATCASDTKYRFFSAFRSWVDGAIFSPNVGVEVKIKIEPPSSNPTDFGIRHCDACVTAMRTSKILDSVSSINWSQIDSFDLTTIVSYMVFVKKETVIVFNYLFRWISVCIHSLRASGGPLNLRFLMVRLRLLFRI